MSTGDRELDWQKSFAGPAGEWPQGDGAFWQSLYRFGPLPVFIIVFASIAGLMAGIRSIRLRPWRRVFWFLILLATLAPGVIANLIFKEHWGRPRPREITEFGGRYSFEPIFTYDPSSPGKSFPCGHATAGFFLVAAYFLLRRSHPVVSFFVLFLTLGWGALLGYMRMIQGGHFATDVVWAGAITFLTAAVLFRLLGLHREVLDDPAVIEASPGIPLKVKLAGGIGIAALIFAIALAMPYEAARDYAPRTEGGDSLSLKPSITVALGDVEIVPGKQLNITGKAWGHGLPTSKIADRWEENVDEDVLRVKYLQRLSGYLTEIRQTLKVEMPWDRITYCKFDLGPGHSQLRLPKPSEAKRMELRLEDNALTLQLEPGALLELAPESVDLGEIVSQAPAAAVYADDGPRYVIVFTKWEGGSLTIESLGPKAKSPEPAR
jgi:membrane-associated phospholipid phosphatase